MQITFEKTRDYDMVSRKANKLLFWRRKQVCIPRAPAILVHERGICGALGGVRPGVTPISLFVGADAIFVANSARSLAALQHEARIVLAFALPKAGIEDSFINFTWIERNFHLKDGRMNQLRSNLSSNTVNNKVD